MNRNRRFTNEQIIDAYKETGSVWSAAKTLGACGQSIWERLRLLNYKLPGSAWTTGEIDEMELLAPQCTVGEIARRLGRTYAGVACKISELGIGVRYGNGLKRKSVFGTGLTKPVMVGHFKALIASASSVRQFCKQRGIDLETFVSASQKHVPEQWTEYVLSHSELEEKTCPQCLQKFTPMTGKQESCSRRCSAMRNSDKKYFGGKRANTIGLSEGICQLCERERPKLSSHHMLGKQNDPENDFLIALCAGCHALVGSLGVRSDVEKPEFWENLIALAMIRKMGHKKPLGYHVCVDIEEITQADIDHENDCNGIGPAASEIETVG